jgi:hypothetical protein
VLVNGIDDCGESQATQKTARTQLFCDQFPDADVQTFDSFYEQDGVLHDGYARDKAKAIIKHLQRSAVRPPCDHVPSHESLYSPGQLTKIQESREDHFCGP